MSEDSTTSTATTATEDCADAINEVILSPAELRNNKSSSSGGGGTKVGLNARPSPRVIDPFRTGTLLSCLLASALYVIDYGSDITVAIFLKEVNKIIIHLILRELRSN